MPTRYSVAFRCLLPVYPFLPVFWKTYRSTVGGPWHFAKATFGVVNTRTATLLDQRTVLFGLGWPQHDIQNACWKMVILTSFKTSTSHCILFVLISTEDPGCSSRKVLQSEHPSRINKQLHAASPFPLCTEATDGSPSGFACDRLLVPLLTWTNVEHSVASNATRFGSLKRMRAIHNLRQQIYIAYVGQLQLIISKLGEIQVPGQQQIQKNKQLRNTNPEGRSRFMDFEYI